MLTLARQAVRELQQHRRLTMQTQLLIRCLEPVQRRALEQYLPSLARIDTLDLDDDYTWGHLLAGVGLLADFKALPEEVRLGESSVLATLVADQPLILEHMLELVMRDRQNINDAFYEYALRLDSRNCLAVLLRLTPEKIWNLMWFALRDGPPPMVAFLVEIWPASVERDLNQALVMGSSFKDQDWDIVRPLIDAGATATAEAMKAAAGVGNLEFMSFFQLMGVTDLNPVVKGALTMQVELSLSWLKSHGANPDEFIRTGTYFELYRARSLLVKYWPECVNSLLLRVARKADPNLVAELLDQGAASTEAVVAQVLLDEFPEQRRQKLVLLGATSHLSWSEWLLGYLI